MGDLTRAGTGKVSARKVRAVTASVAHNEALTRARVDQLEAWAAGAGDRMGTLARSVGAFQSMGFWARLRWLVRGQ